MRRTAARVLNIVSVCAATAGTASADVVVTEDKDEWLSMAGEVTTVDFTGFAEFEFITDQYLGLGVLFSDGDDQITVQDPMTFPNDSWGARSVDTPFVMEFATPQSWLAVEFPGFVRVRIFSRGQPVFVSAILGASGEGNFAGLLTKESFDEARIEDPFDDLVAADDIHFGPRLPGDANGDAIVNIDDLMAVILGWGQCSETGGPCPPDVTHDGTVNVDDLIEVVLSWD